MIPLVSEMAVWLAFTACDPPDSSEAWLNESCGVHLPADIHIHAWVSVRHHEWNRSSGTTHIHNDLNKMRRGVVDHGDGGAGILSEQINALASIQNGECI